MMNISILENSQHLEQLASEWDELASENPDTADGLDATSGFAWFDTLSKTFPACKSARIVVAREGGKLAGVLPLISQGGFVKRLAVATELYGGRNGLLISRQDPKLLNALLQGATDAYGPWQYLQLTVVEGSRSDITLQEAVGQGLVASDTGARQSPYFPLLASQDAFLQGTSKSLRQTIRTSTNKLKSTGEISYTNISSDSTANITFEAILQIERASWKHEAGTAITRKPDQESFYRNLFESRLCDGLLYGIVMHSDDIPIAYNFGLIRSGYYSCLKHSNRQDFQNTSPNQVLNVELVDRLRARGVAIYDYMGSPEPHKMRWSPETRLYSRRSVRIFNRSLWGKFGVAILNFKQRMRVSRSQMSDSKSVGHDENT